MVKSRRLRWEKLVTRVQLDRSAFRILTGKSTVKRPLERPRLRWEDNIRIDLKEIGTNTRSLFDWVDYWRALVNATLNSQVP